MSFVARFHRWYGTKPVEPAPKLEGTAAGRSLIIAAGARCVWDDLMSMGVDTEHGHPSMDLMTVNDIVCYLAAPVAHHYGNDHRSIPHHLEVRRLRHLRSMNPVQQTHSCRTGAMNNWPWPGHGTSALGATYTALALGYDSIVLCGVPLDNTGHFFDPPNGKYTHSRFHEEVSGSELGLQYWADAACNLFDGRVRSMSGRTRNLLGAPELQQAQ